MPTTITTTAVQDVLNDLAENERALATPENDKGRAGTRPLSTARGVGSRGPPP